MLSIHTCGAFVSRFPNKHSCKVKSYWSSRNWWLGRAGSPRVGSHNGHFRSISYEPAFAKSWCFADDAEHALKPAIHESGRRTEHYKFGIWLLLKKINFLLKVLYFQFLGTNPQLQSMFDMNPQLREMMQNPEIIRQLTSPEMMQVYNNGVICLFHLS